MTEAFDRKFWEQRWAQAVREHGDTIAAPAAGQVQVSVDDAVAALDPARWEFVIAEERTRAATGTGVDAVICARRHP